MGGVSWRTVPVWRRERGVCVALAFVRVTPLQGSSRVNDGAHAHECSPVDNKGFGRAALLDAHSPIATDLKENHVEAVCATARCRVLTLQPTK